MRAFLLLCLAVLLLPTIPLAQRLDTPECGYIPSEKDNEWYKAAASHLDELALRRGPGTRFVPVKFHVLQPSTGLGVCKVDHVFAALDKMNEAFSSADFSFYVCNDIHLILNNSWYYAKVDFNIRNALRGYDVGSVLNVYIVRDMDLCGAAFTGGQVFVDFDCLIDNNYSTLIHEIGHFFNLKHTFENDNEGFPRYCGYPENCANCCTAGDLLCDTPADREIFNSGDYDGSCNLNGNRKFYDDCGYRIIPNPRNYMAYGSKTCRSEFSNGQITIMKAKYDDLGLCCPKKSGNFAQVEISRGATTVNDPNNFSQTLSGYQYFNGETFKNFNIWVDSDATAELGYAVVVGAEALRVKQGGLIDIYQSSSACNHLRSDFSGSSKQGEERLLAGGVQRDALLLEKRRFLSWPQPFTQYLNLEYTNEREERVHLAIYDLNGRQVRVLAEGKQAKGVQRLVYNLGDLPSGLFLLKYRIGNWEGVEKIHHQ